MRPMLGAVIGGVGSAVLVAGLSVPAIKAACGTFTRGKNTHLLVSEERVKVLKAIRCCGVGALRMVLQEVNRDGVGYGDYVVPAGRTFIVTDVVARYFTPNDVLTTNRIDAHLTASNQLTGRLSLTQYFPQSLNSNQEFPLVAGVWHLTGGVPYDEGSKVNLAITLPIGQTAEMIGEAEVIGYEADDACP